MLIMSRACQLITHCCWNYIQVKAKTVAKLLSLHLLQLGMTKEFFWKKYQRFYQLATIMTMKNFNMEVLCKRNRFMFHFVNMEALGDLTYMKLIMLYFIAEPST